MTPMDTIGAYLDVISKNKIERATFAASNKAPFLVTVEVMEDALPGMTPEGTSAATVAQDPQKMRRASIAAREAHVWPILKREGANPQLEILVGRSRDNDVWINDAEVSKHHARLFLTKGEWSLVDTGSTNGTFINEKRIENNKPVVVRTYDSVRLGRAAKMQFLDPESFFDYLSVLRRFVGL
jgi:hypothetical protein